MKKFTTHLTNNISKIPSSQKNFYLIKKSDTWKNSIEISFNPYTKLNIYNLYGILKSYLNNKTILCISVAFCWKKIEDNQIITDNIRAEELNRMNFYKFEIWFLNKITFEKKYDPNQEMKYMILLTFGQIFIEKYNIANSENILDKLRPNYPWKITRKELIIKKEINKNPILKYYIKKIL